MLEKLLEDLESRFPNKLPTKEISSYELGKLIGIQEVIVYVNNAVTILKTTTNKLPINNSIKR